MAARTELRGRRVAIPAMSVLALLLSACESGPRPIRAGDTCAYCLMGVAEERFAGELITKRGQARVFDSIECLVRYLASDSAEAVRSIWVTDYESPPHLIDARRAYFIRSDGIHSPMGLGVAAFSTAAARDATIAKAGGTPLDWKQVTALVRTRFADGSNAVAHTHVTTRPIGGTDSAAGEIALAVAAASPGDTVRIPAGTYHEPTVVIRKPLTLIGNGAVLDGDGKRGLLRVEADDVVIRGFTLRNVGTSYIEDRAAIRVESGKRCRIEDNRIENGFFGIYLAGTEGCEIRRNTLTSSVVRESAAGNGIHLWHSSGVTVEDNSIRGYRDGLYFEFVTNSTVRRNDSESNLRYGLHFMFSNDCRYEGNRFRANGAGVAVMYTSGVDMTGNAFEENRGPASYGLLLKDIRDSRIENNTFRLNSVGLYAEGSDRLTVAGNAFTGNGWAVKVMSNSETNEFSANDFTGNSFDVATNGRQNHSTFNGNYWDAYRGHDLDRDGSGDTPFRPVRLFSVMVERNAPSLILMHSFFVHLLDAAESVIPALTPATLVDAAPRMEPYRGAAATSEEASRDD